MFQLNLRGGAGRGDVWSATLEINVFWCLFLNTVQHKAKGLLSGIKGEKGILFSVLKKDTYPPKKISSD